MPAKGVSYQDENKALKFTINTLKKENAALDKENNELLDRPGCQCEKDDRIPDIKPYLNMLDVLKLKIRNGEDTGPIIYNFSTMLKHLDTHHKHDNEK